MGINLNRSQFLYETDEWGMPITKEIPNVTVSPHQVCHVDDWEAVLAGKFSRFTVAKVKYDTHFPGYNAPADKLKAGERVIVLNEFALPSNVKSGTKPNLYVRRCSTGSPTGMNWDTDCFEHVPADCLEVISRKKKHAICVNCGVQKLKRKMKVCDACLGPCYCGKKCQKLHWTIQHKYECPKSKASKAKPKAEL